MGVNTTPGALGPLWATVIVASQGLPAEGVDLSVLGTTSLLGVSPVALEFPAQATGSSTSQVVTVTNLGGDPLSIEDGLIDPAGASEWSLTSSAGTLAPGASKEVTITFAPKADGSFSATASFGASSAKSAVVQLTGVGVGAATGGGGGSVSGTGGGDVAAGGGGPSAVTGCGCTSIDSAGLELLGLIGFLLWRRETVTGARRNRH
jgi:hypothetical protein